MTLFLDACTVIYWVESRSPFYEKFVKMLQKLRERHPSSSFAASRLSWLECRIRPLQEKNEALLKLYSEFFSMADLKIVELEPRVVDTAASLRAKHGLRTPDALQAASVLALEDSALFLSSDACFKKVPGLKVVSI